MKLFSPKKLALPHIFTIGSQQCCHLNAFAPSATSGNTQSAAHFLGGMNKAADSATFDIEVLMQELTVWISSNWNTICRFVDGAKKKKKKKN